MEVLILDENFESLMIIDTFESLIWTERYSSCGDFELYTGADEHFINQIQQGYYIQIPGSDETMIIEQIEVETDFEEGNHVTLSGRSLASILDRRIVWVQTTVVGKIQTCLKTLITDNIINPSNTDTTLKEKRKIKNFIFEMNDDPNVADLDMRSQYTGDNLYDVVLEICATYDLGFYVRLDENNNFVFKLYAGADRSYGQDQYPPVIFSPTFDNISSTSYLESDKTLKNVTLVAGEDQGTARRTNIVGDEEGLDRRELFTDARDIQSEYTDENNVHHVLTESEYLELLYQRGEENLAENQSTKVFDGSIEPVQGSVYGSDFFQGDILQVENQFGFQAKVRVTELIISQDESGTKVTPTFSVIDSGMNATERKFYTKVMMLLTEFGIMDDDYNGDISELTVKDIAKLENHALLDETFEGIMAYYSIPDMLKALEEHIILDDDYVEVLQ